MPQLDYTLPILAGQTRYIPNLMDVQAKLDEREARRLQQEQLAQEREYLIEERKQQLAERRAIQQQQTWLGQNAALFSTVDPTSGAYSMNWEGLAGAALKAGYPDLSMRLADQGTKLQKAHEDFVNARLAYHQKLGAVKSAALLGVHGEEDWPTFMSTMQNYLPDREIETLKQAFPEFPGMERVKTELATLQDQQEQYLRAMDPQGYRKAELELKQLEGRANVSPDEYHRIIDQSIAALPAGAQQAAKAMATLAHGRVTEAFRVGDRKQADDAMNDLQGRIAMLGQLPYAQQFHVTVGGDDKSNAKDIADAIESGEQPPTTQGLYRLAPLVRAELSRRGFNLANATLDWQATTKFLATLQGAQQTRLRQAAETAYHSLDVIDGLAKEWDAGQFPVLNHARMVAAKNGALGDKAASIATRLEAQINDLTSELGNVYMGGNSPTDHALTLAKSNLSGDWSRKVLQDATDLARKNLQIRLNSMKNMSPAGLGGPSAYAPTTPTVDQTPPASTAWSPKVMLSRDNPDFRQVPVGGTMVQWLGPAAGVYRKDPSGNPIGVMSLETLWQKYPQQARATLEQLKTTNPTQYAAIVKALQAAGLMSK